MMDWLRKRAMGVALALASSIAFLSLFSPPFLDFVFDLIMVGIIAVIGQLAKKDKS